MCLAIFKPRGVSVPTEYLHSGWVSNPDGAGYAFVKDGEVQIRKGFMKLKEFLAAYNTDIHDHADSPFIIHFRIRTMGEKDESNTHPFAIDGGALIHNGSISGTGATYNVGLSDTHLFANKFKSDLSLDFMMRNKDSMDAALTGNRMAILYANKGYHIVNEHKGKWDDGVWYSNSGYKSSAYGGYGVCEYDWE